MKSMAWSSTKMYQRNWKQPEFYQYCFASGPLILILSSLFNDEQLIKYRKLKQEGQYFLQETGSQKNESDIKLQTKPVACQEVLMSIRFQNYETWTCHNCNITFLEPISLVSFTIHPEHNMEKNGTVSKEALVKSPIPQHLDLCHKHIPTEPELYIS